MTDRTRRTRGSALILVMGVLVLLSIVGTAFVLLMRIELQAARNFVEDTQAQFLAKQALAYCLEHPNWPPPHIQTPPDPPDSGDIDNDSLGGRESLFFTYPLSDLASDTSARFAILKKPFAGRLNVNWNGFYIPDGPNTDGFQALNEGTSPTEVSLEKAIAAYLAYVINTYGPFPGANTVDCPDIAREIAARICNYRYGQGQLADFNPPTVGPYPVFHGAAAAGVPPTGVRKDASAVPVENAYPGEYAVDDTRYVDDANRFFEGMLPPPIPPEVDAPPDRRDTDDVWTPARTINTWVGAYIAPPSPSVNWRPDPIRDLVDEDGDGLFDEPSGSPLAGSPVENVDEPQEFLERVLLLPGRWPVNDDRSFDSADLAAIIANVGNPALKAIVQDVFETWTPAQGYPGYGPGTDYFDYMRPIFTTYNRDYIGDQKPLNHLNLLLPAAPTAEELDAVKGDRNDEFFSAMQEALVEGGMNSAAATNTAWQVLANLIDFLDDDADAAGNLYWDPTAIPPNTLPRGILTTFTEGGRQFHGTERQPYCNEFWIYNRRNDRYDNDNDTIPDDDPISDPSAGPWEEEGTSGNNGYFIELTNQYATAITLYNKPTDTTTDPTVDWYIRVLDSGGSERAGSPYRISAAQVWNGGNWQVAAGFKGVTVPAGGYLVIEFKDFADASNAVQPAGDNVKLAGNSLKLLPTPQTMPVGSELLTLYTFNEAPAQPVFFQAGDTIDLVYSYDPDGSDGPLPADEAVVDRQKLPAAMNDYASMGSGTYDFAPSFERQDPRLSATARVSGAFPAGTLLLPTRDYVDAETALPTSGGDSVRNTVDAVNDAGDGDADVFDGNYDLGAVRDGSIRYDDLVEIPNSQEWKFGNVGGLGSLLCVGPMPLDPTAAGWTAADWLVTHSPYTHVNPAAPGANPIDAKKVNFTDPIDAADTAGNVPAGRASAIFDKFTTWCPWRDGKDNNLQADPGVWDASKDDVDGDGGPTPGDPHVDDATEEYAYGRVAVNEKGPAAEACLAALPFVVYDPADRNFDPAGVNAPNFFIPAAIALDSIAVKRALLPDGRFTRRRQFFETVVKPLINPAAGFRFGMDKQDNHIYELNPGTGWVLRRWDTARPQEWQTIQRPPRTATTAGTPSIPASSIPAMFKLEGQADDGGDFLVDDKSEIDYTVGALMNEIALENELPQEFASAADIGDVTYFITVQITDGRDVDGIDDDGDGTGVAQPDWKEGSILAEKRIMAQVNTALPSTAPQRIRIFNWSTEGRQPVR